MDAQAYQQIRNRELPDQIEVQIEDLEAQAREYNVYDLEDFFASSTFAAHNFVRDEARRLIIKRFWRGRVAGCV